MGDLGNVRRETLSRSACVARLAEADLARVVISVRCLPAALPARVAVVDDQHLLLASPEEAVVTAADRAEVLSVQVDGLEPDGATWSVMASGIARTVATDAALNDRLRDAVARGATIVELPLSVVVGERVG
ncbi:MAG: pyridoxamine 5'-phosphate oxidase family protein [Acidimicrobiales bacterium]